MTTLPGNEKFCQQVWQQDNFILYRIIISLLIWRDIKSVLCYIVFIFFTDYVVQHCLKKETLNSVLYLIFIYHHILKEKNIHIMGNVNFIVM